MAPIAVGIGVGVGFGLKAGASASAAGLAATAYGVQPDVHYHPNAQAGAVTRVVDRITGCPSLGALAAAMSGLGPDGSTVVGPYEMTDGLGRRFWRFNGAEYATIANALANISSRAVMTLLVGRFPHSSAPVNIVKPRFAAYTSPTVNTQANASISLMNTYTTTNAALTLRAQVNPQPHVDNPTNCYKITPGAQLQVACVASRATASGGQRVYINNDACDIGQVSTLVSAYLGGIIAGTAGASNTENVTTNTDNHFDLYELAIWNTTVLNAAADARVAEAVANFAIPALDTNLALVGDSITYGIPTTLPVNPAYHGALATWLTNPGAALIAPNVRVMNLGISGAKVADLVTRRDAVGSLFANGLYPGGPGKNIIAVQIGRNDLIVTATTAAIEYASIVALWNTVTTGYLQRGWSGVHMGNVAMASTNIPSAPEGTISMQQRNEALRALTFAGANTLLDQFKTDLGVNVGGAFEGRVTGCSLYLIADADELIFDQAADVSDTEYFDSDVTHLLVGGHQMMASGGTTPQYGYGSLA